MLAGALMWVSIPAAGFIGTVGAVSVIKAVYIDRRDIKCAWVGGSNGEPYDGRHGNMESVGAH